MTRQLDSLRILQMFNRGIPGAGADNVVNDEAGLLRAAGHSVEQLIIDRGTSTTRLSEGLKAVWNREAAEQAREILVGFRPHVVHVHDPFPVMSPVVFRVAASFGVPSVATVHNYRYSCIKGSLYRDGGPCTLCVGSRIKFPGILHGCKTGSRIAAIPVTTSLAFHHYLGTFTTISYFIALSELSRSVLVDDGYAEQRIVVKPNAVPDPGYERTHSRSGFFLFFGRLVATKGVNTLLQAWRQMDSPPPLIVAGDGPLAGEVKAAADDVSQIEYRGWVSRDELTRLLQRAEATIFPSRLYEAGPLAILESFACGTPVIASDTGVARETVADGNTGLLFRTGDPDSLARAVGRLDQAPGEGRRLGENARHEYELRYTPAASLRVLEDLYRKVVTEGTPQKRL